LGLGPRDPSISTPSLGGSSIIIVITISLIILLLIKINLWNYWITGWDDLLSGIVGIRYGSGC